MIFISYNQLVKDVLQWSEQLPYDFDLIVGVPRSGILVASILALHRNIPLVDVDTFATGSIFKGGFRDQHRKIKKVFVVDDSILSGHSILTANNKLQNKQYKILYGALYIKQEDSRWFYFKVIPLPRVFEWNMFHGYWTQHCCMDIDGVLCRDPTAEENDDGLQYSKFLHTVLPRHLPTVEIQILVTSRLEKYRIDTVKWLARCNIKYKNLIMHPASTKSERIKLKDHAIRKADVYRNSGLRLFIESSESQAQQIYKLTKLPVICTDTMMLYA